MKRVIGGAALLVAAASLAACGAKKDPNLPTDEESVQLNNAAEMLDASPDSLAVDENVALGNGEVAQDSIDEDEGNGAGNGQ